MVVKHSFEKMKPQLCFLKKSSLVNNIIINYSTRNVLHPEARSAMLNSLEWSMSSRFDGSIWKLSRKLCLLFPR